ncbi:Uncharacterised protein [Acinetobacter baumannii]|uniref:Uncharacterized protein n=1 Tax=Acinetobacter phage AbTZA1 TaxID=2500827 RepID=A0A3Q9R777_9CAUD|nr:hypothetical protein HYP74_gp046 [Acinetobacter phage AbTZA1]QQO96249.1 hypothetical protein CPT_Minot_046 [Acinetobacter phage Minot]QQO96498.1 hypothetical protein CPT_Mokit_047 [Acinetobacter phage Mokit]QQO96752.1 hypothetical protein CPT_Melin_051 [Acinetobacter phage Melin]SSU39399.1 Uncharacterised protein [Acinetobacter baumannii]AZU98676.1 hypothetical protein [Acinetobacter phage AbTZA1]
MKILIEFASDGSTITFTPVDLDVKALNKCYSDNGAYYEFSEFSFRVPILELADHQDRILDIGYWPHFDGFSKVILIDDINNVEFEFEYPEILSSSTSISKTYVYISLKGAA